MNHIELINKLPKELRNNIFTNITEFELMNLNEIRLRLGQKIEIIFKGTSRILNNTKRLVKKDIEDCFLSLCDYSIFAFEEDICQGFFTVNGGHRVGVCGKILLDDKSKKIKKIINISSLNMRITREIFGVSDKIFHLCVPLKNILVISPPCCGKTTLIRDLTRRLSNYGYRVTLIDERSEIAGTYNGKAQNDCGSRTDIYDSCPKNIGINMAIRSTNPNLVVLDEIGTEEELEGIRKAFNSGVSILATVHSDSIESFMKKETFKEIVKRKDFELYLYLHNNKGDFNISAYDENFEVIL